MGRICRMDRIFGAGMAPDPWRPIVAHDWKSWASMVIGLRTWRSLGFIGSCFLMNSDVLVFNRLFRFMPGIRSFTRFMTSVDDATLRVPGLGHAGVAVVGVAVKT